MSRILESQNAATTTGALAKNPQSVVRRKLADISNLPQNQRPFIQENKSQSIETTTKEYIDQLQKENMALVKMLAQRNKIIEQSGTELDRLRINLLKMHEQNQQLELSNSQMLVELNTGKDRLKVFNARKLELEEKAITRPCKNADTELITSLEKSESSKQVKVDEKPQKTKRSSQSNTFDSSEQGLSKETTQNKRTLPDDPVPKQGSTSESPLSKNEDNKNSCGLRYEAQEFERSSLCRPSRLAAQKVRSYKEIPIKVKMRRPV